MMELKTERVDDLPLLIAKLEESGLSDLLNVLPLIMRAFFNKFSNKNKVQVNRVDLGVFFFF